MVPLFHSAKLGLFFFLKEQLQIYTIEILSYISDDKFVVSVISSIVVLLVGYFIVGC